MLLSERIRHRLRQQGRAEGLEEGRAEGREEGREVGLEEGREVGREEGREVGHAEGREVGRAEERREFASAITAWYERQQRALERGEKFDEPPPGVKR